MATGTTEHKLQQLRAENKRLRAENKQLRASTVPDAPTKTRSPHSVWRRISIILGLGFVVALLVVGNILFWAGNTVVKTDRFVAATAPIIQNAEVQSALAGGISTKLFEQVDVDALAEEALPPRAAFLAPTFSTQIKQQTNGAVLKILQRPQFQDRWNKSLEHSHTRLITTIENHGADGSLDISEVYSDVSQQLKGTKLSFLADKQLPEKVGNIQLVQGSWMSALNVTIHNIDLWRSLTIVLLVAVSTLVIWLSRNRRKLTIVLSSLFAASMLLTLISMRIGREVIASNAEPQNAEAVRQIFTIFTHGLAIQTWTLFAAALVVAFAAWTSGPYRSSIIARQKLDQLFSGKLHQALFGENENGLTRWFGAHKRVVEWLIVAVVASFVLFVQLTLGMLFGQVILVALLVLIVEVLSAKE